MSALDKARYEKIANMMVMGVAQTQIAEVMSISEGRISQLLQEDEFKKILEEKMLLRQVEMQEINQGWDDVETKALRIVQDNLKHNKNPDFALKAAMVANRANRRGGNGGNAPLPAAMGERVLIKLQGTFINKLMNVGGVPVTQASLRDLINSSQQKRVNLLAPGQVKKLLQDEKENEDNFDPQMVVLEDIDLSDVG